MPLLSLFDGNDRLGPRPTTLQLRFVTPRVLLPSIQGDFWQLSKPLFPSAAEADACSPRSNLSP
jgi:hypothetical protein